MSDIDTVLLALGRGDRALAWRMAGTALAGGRLFRRCWRRNPPCDRTGAMNASPTSRSIERDRDGRAPSSQELRVDAYHARRDSPACAKPAHGPDDRGRLDHLQRVGGRHDRRACQIQALWSALASRSCGPLASSTASRLPVIGRALGNRDHTTVISGLKRAEELREKTRTSARSRTACSPWFTPKIPDGQEEAENAPSSH
jgi:hypothetical protein